MVIAYLSTLCFKPKRAMGGVHAEIRQAHIVLLFFVIWISIKKGDT